MARNGEGADVSSVVKAAIDVGLRLRHALVEALAPLGVTPEQHEVLAAIAGGSTSAGEIARSTGRDKTTLSRIVARARRSGLVTIDVPDVDRRRQVLVLTEEGRAKVTLGQSAVDRAISGALGSLKPRQLRRLSKLLAKLRNGS